MTLVVGRVKIFPIPTIWELQFGAHEVFTGVVRNIGEVFFKSINIAVAILACVSNMPRVVRYGRCR